jgi:hypothetical protein
MTYDIEAIRNNPNARVVIAGGNARNKPIRGILVDTEFSAGNNAEFNQPFLGELTKQLSEMMNNIATSVNMASENFQFPQMKLMNIRQTVEIWSNTPKPEFSVNMLFVSIREEEDVREDIKSLLQFVYPTIPEKNGLGLEAPNGYRVTRGQGKHGLSAVGTASIYVGEWFYAPLQIITGVNYTFSTRILPNNSPLYARATINFKPFRMIARDEYFGYFKGANQP